MYQNALSYPSIIPQVHTYLHISVGLKSTTRIPARRIPFGNKDAKQYQRASSISLLVNYQKSELTSTEGEKPPSQRSFVKIDELHSKLLKSKLTHSQAQPTRNPSTPNIQADTFINIPTPDNLEHLLGFILFLCSRRQFFCPSLSVHIHVCIGILTRTGSYSSTTTFLY